VDYTINIISNEKKWGADTCSNMNESQKYFVTKETRYKKTVYAPIYMQSMNREN
jgi:hypothetical protein